MQVYNTAGQMVYSGEAANMNLNKGVYIINDGAQTRKVMIK